MYFTCFMFIIEKGNTELSRQNIATRIFGDLAYWFTKTEICYWASIECFKVM